MKFSGKLDFSGWTSFSHRHAPEAGKCGEAGV